MKSLIVYYSYTGNNEALAKEMKLRFGSDLYKIFEKKHRNAFTILLDVIFKRETEIEKPDIFLIDYDVVIFMAPIWDSKIATPLKSFIKMECLSIRNYAFISICTGHEGQSQKINAELFELTNRKPIAVTELSVNDLLLPEQKDKIRYTTPYRVKEGDFNVFKKQIQNFVNAVFETVIHRTDKSKSKELVQ